MSSQLPYVYGLDQHTPATLHRVAEFGSKGCSSLLKKEPTDELKTAIEACKSLFEAFKNDEMLNAVSKKNIDPLLRYSCRLSREQGWYLFEKFRNASAKFDKKYNEDDVKKIRQELENAQKTETNPTPQTIKNRKMLEYNDCFPIAVQMIQLFSNLQLGTKVKKERPPAAIQGRVDASSSSSTSSSNKKRKAKSSLQKVAAEMISPLSSSSSSSSSKSKEHRSKNLHESTDDATLTSNKKAKLESSQQEAAAKTSSSSSSSISSSSSTSSSSSSYSLSELN